MAEKAIKNRRSIKTSARTTILRFHEKDAVPAQGPAFGLFVTHLESVEVGHATIKEDSKGLASFAGREIPRLILRFESNHSDASERRHVSMTFNPAESNVDTIPGGSAAWQVDNIFTWMLNILDVFLLKGRSLTDEENDALSLPFSDVDEEGNYVPVEVDDVISGYQVLFENFAAMMNGTYGTNPTNKPIYKTDKGTMIPLWTKLTRYQKAKNDWRATGNNGELAFDVFYRTPLIEIMKGTNPPTKVSLDISKESITPKETKKTPNVGGPAGIGNIGGVVMPGTIPMGVGENTAGIEAGSDMPF